MKFEDYTPSQQKAITTVGNVIVSAGAGSGKTQVLTERVTYFVKCGYKLDEFLILTFTNLAAGEMKDRIRKALTKEGLDAANYVDTADICTFDSYALSIVKKYHFLLNVSPNISIVDSNIISVRKRTIIEDIFEELYKEENQEFLDMIDRFCFKDDIDLKNLVLKLYEKALLSDDTNDYINNYIEHYYNDDLLKEMIFESSELITKKRDEVLKDINKATTMLISKKDPRPFRNAILEVLNDFINAKDYDDLISSCPEKLGFKSPSGMEDDEKKENASFLKHLKELFKFVHTFPNTKEDFKLKIKSNIKYTKVLLDIIIKLDERIMSYKDKYQVYEFNDIAKLALNLVKTNEEIRNNIKNKLKMIMIDEYQDTSSLQEAFINQIGNNNVYMVGDVKQSIYRFRNARCDIFIDKYEKYKHNNGGTAIDLNKNFRSRKEVLSDINYMFKNLMTKEYGGADYRLDHIIEFGNTAYITKGLKKEAEHSTIIFHNERGLDSPTNEAHIIARDIINKINNKYQVLDKEGLRPCKFSDFCILMDRGSEFDTYAKVFSEYHLPLYIENDENISECDIVLILINLLRLIKAINENDYESPIFKKSFIGVVRSFLFNYTDDELLVICDKEDFENDKVINKIKDILYEYKTYPLAKQFEQIIFNLDIYNKLIYSGDVTKNEKYLDMFLGMFSDMSKLDYTLDDFIIYMENIDTYDLKITLSAVGSNIDSIKIMNIHKSKGLEFNIIYFSGLYKGFNQSEYKSNFGVSNKYGLIFKPENEDEVNIVKVLNNKYEYKEDISEKIRLFYVALTRTKEKMIFVVRNADATNLITEELNHIALAEFIDLMNENYTSNIVDIAKCAVDMYKDKIINTDTFKLILDDYNIPLPNNKLYGNVDKIVSNLEDLINMIMKYQSRMLDKKEVVLAFNEMFNNHELTKKEFIFTLDYLNADIAKGVDEITRNDIIDLDKESIEDVHDECDYLEDDTEEDSEEEQLEQEEIEEEIFNQDIVSYILGFIDEHKDYPFNLDLYELLFRIIGYNITNNTKTYLTKLHNEHVSDDCAMEFNNLKNNDKFIPVDNINEIMDQYSTSYLFSRILEEYQSKNITLNDFSYLLGIFNYELDIDFKLLKEEDKLKVDKKYIMEYITVKDVLVSDLKEANKFNDFLLPFLNNYVFDYEYFDLELKAPVLNEKLEEEQSEKLDVREIEVNTEKQEIFRASKKLDLSASKKNMDFGTKMHFIMEITDFINPDYSIIKDDLFKGVVKKFLASDILGDLSTAKIYKEYEFFDEVNHTNGIIDLMIVYPDHIDIIDYKTKNIDDESYDKQLKIYEDFVKTRFNLPINTYLYSLLTGIYRKCN